MRILVIGLDGAAPELLFGDERLVNVRRMMDAGTYGRLESVVSPTTVPAWMCMGTGQDPGTLGVYGVRNRADHSYDGLQAVHSRSIHASAVWDEVARAGKKSLVLGVPPNFPPRTPDTSQDVFTRTGDQAKRRDDLQALTRAQFAAARQALRRDDWDFFQFVALGLDRIQHAFWRHHDPDHVRHEPDSPYRDVIRDHYRSLDEEIGGLLELLDEETVVLIASDHGVRPLDGGFCINEWLIREGLLTLHSYPETVTPFSRLDVDWGRTVAWSEGGDDAGVFLNVKGREPRGSIEQGDYTRVRDDLKARLEATTGPDGAPLGTLVFRPEEVYRSVRNVAPDLIVHFGALAWRSVGGVGRPTVHILDNDNGLDDCNHAQHGAFVLAGPNVAGRGMVAGAHLLGVAPTLLELGGYDVPPSMRHHAPIASRENRPDGPSDDGAALVLERLRGLGYIG